MSVIEQDPLFVIKVPREYQSGGISTWNGAIETKTGSSVAEIPIEDTNELLDRLTIAGLRKHDIAKVREVFRGNYNWVPYSLAEMTLAVKGVKTKIDKIVGRVSDHTLGATERVYDQAGAFKANAINNLHTLRFAKALDEDEDPSVELIRRDVDVKIALADYKQACASMSELTWHPRKGKRKSLILNPRELQHRGIMEELEEMSDEDLVKLWHETYNCNWGRAEHWATQESNARENELVAAIEKERQSVRRAS